MRSAWNRPRARSGNICPPKGNRHGEVTRYQSPRFFGSLRLESQSERHLEQTWVVLLRSNLAEGVVCGRRLPAIGGSELNPVEQVERLGPELQIEPFRDSGPFEHGEVVVPDSRAA